MTLEPPRLQSSLKNVPLGHPTENREYNAMLCYARAKPPAWATPQGSGEDDAVQRVAHVRDVPPFTEHARAGTDSVDQYQTYLHRLQN